MIHVLVVLAFYSNVCGARRILYLPTEALSGGGGGGHSREVWEGVSNY